MPTLEDTVDFKVPTLNDLLEADIHAGVPVAADDRYKRWAFLSSGLAGMLAIGLVVALVTGGGSSGGGSSSGKAATAPPGTRPLNVTPAGELTSDIKPTSIVSIIGEGGTVLSGNATVLQLTSVKKFGRVSTNIQVAVPLADAAAVTAAIADRKPLLVQSGPSEKTTPTSAPTAATSPAPAAPTPAPPAPTQTTPSS